MLVEAYYLLKPLIPRRAQLHLRRRMVLRKRARLDGTWPVDERAGRPPAGWPGWPGGKRFAFVLTHDVDTAEGQRKCLDLMAMEKGMGFASSFNFVPRRYAVCPAVRYFLERGGFEVGVHGLYHDGKYLLSRGVFRERAARINRYLREWGSVGFRMPSMLHRLDWFHDLDIAYDASTFDTDPFEPQPEGVGTIFPFRVEGGNGRRGFVELPYTMPQDFTLFVLMKETDISIWKEKLDWIAEKGGMALLSTHPDYMCFDGGRPGAEEYPADHYRNILSYVKTAYGGSYWHALPRVVAAFFRETVAASKGSHDALHQENPVGAGDEDAMKTDEVRHRGPLQLSVLEGREASRDPGVPDESLLFDFVQFELARRKGREPVASTENLIEAGIIDSLGIIKLIMFLEEHYAVKVSDDDITPENFETIRSICDLVQRKCADGARNR